jgi:hypothetical protein
VKEGWGCSSVVEYFPSIHEALGSISSTTKNKQTKNPENTNDGDKKYNNLPEKFSGELYNRRFE